MTVNSLRGALFWALFPPLIPQALWVRSRAPRTPPASGPVKGSAGQGPPLRLLGLGDSIIAGVGTQHTHQALTAQLAACLAPAHQVEWHALGQSGAPLGRIVDQLMADMDRRPYDLVVISAGVNDVTGLTSGRAFCRQLERLATRLRQHSPAARIVLLGLPPMGDFPLIPQPLRWVLGQRARALDALLARAAEGDQLLHLPMAMTPQPEQFADDGYHPSAESVGAWAQSIADQLNNRLC